MCAIALWLATACFASYAPDRNAQKPYALIAGTVFTEDGVSLRGAEITLIPEPQDAKQHKLKKQQALSDSRGEFALRVPALPARYTIKVKRPGFADQEKPVQVSGDERLDLVIRLEPRK